MKRVLIFSLAYFPHVGGAEVAIKEITDRITGLDFSLITLRMAGEAREEKMGNVQVYRVGNGKSYWQKILYVPRAALLARRLHRENQFDAFWAMMSYMLFPIVLLRLCGLKVPYLLTLQEGDPFEHVFGRARIILFQPLLSAGFKNAAQVQTISTFLARWAKASGYPREPRVIGNGVDIEHFSRGSAKNVQHLVLNTTLVTTSRLVHKNAIDDVIRALPLLPATVRFVIHGIGPEESALKALSKACGVEDRVDFRGHIAYSDIPDALKSCDIFVRPSRSEGMGNSFVEAMAAGLPIIATQEGGIADFLFDSKRNPDKKPTGFAVDKDSPEQIAEAVERILAEPEEVKQVIENAKAMVKENYDWKSIADSMRQVFNDVITD